MYKAKQHVIKKYKAELAAMGVPLMKGFPAQSYDMNLTEVVWGHLQQQLLGHNFKKKHTYEQGLKEAWGRVQQGTINNLVANHNQQMKRIIKAEGSWVNY